MSRRNKKTLRPRYDRRKKTWRVDFEDRHSEEGSLLYVAGEFAKTGLYFPYSASASRVAAATASGSFRNAPQPNAPRIKISAPCAAAT